MFADQSKWQGFTNYALPCPLIIYFIITKLNSRLVKLKVLQGLNLLLCCFLHINTVLSLNHDIQTTEPPSSSLKMPNRHIERAADILQLRVRHLQRQTLP